MFSKKSLVASLLTNQQISISARTLVRLTMLSNSLLNKFYIFKCMFWFRIEKSGFPFRKKNAEFVFGLLRLLKLCKRLVKTNVAQSLVANQSRYSFHQSVAEPSSGFRVFPRSEQAALPLFRILIAWLSVNFPLL